MTTTGHFILADDAAAFARLGIDPDRIASFEDGQRIGTGEGLFEWWYFDAHLDDGTKMVIVFHARSARNPTGDFAPSMDINIDLPDGRSIARTMTGSADAFSAATDRCDVRIGANRFEGDLHRYRITATIEDVSVDIELDGSVPSFRVATSHAYFVRGDERRLFAWLPAVPQGAVRATWRIGAETHAATGHGYHDHNWGDAPMWELMHDWYWCRAKIGPYTVIASYTTAAEEYGHEAQVNFMLARDGEILAIDHRDTRFSTHDVATDAETGKPVADRIEFDFAQGDERYKVAFARETTILRDKFADHLPLLKRLAAKAMGADGAYLRFTGTASIERSTDGKLVERHEEPALWELMYFGHARPVTNDEVR